MLSEADAVAFSSLIRMWLEAANKDVPKLLSRRLLGPAARRLAPALPLAAHLGDIALQEELEEKAKDLRSTADNDLREEFDRKVWRLFKSRAWPSRADGRGSLGRIGVIREESTLFAKLDNLVHKGTGSAHLSASEVIEDGINAAEDGLRAGDFKLPGFLLARMLPVAVSLGESHSARVESLIRRLMSSPLSISERCGFLLECDRLIDNKAWPQEDEAIRSLERSGLETPKTLDRLARREETADRERVLRALDFADELLKTIPVRAGLFLPPLLLVTEKSSDPWLVEKCRGLVSSFVQSTSVSEGIKAAFAKRVKSTVGENISDSLRSTIRSLGLEAPWIAEQARSSAVPDIPELVRQLWQAEQLIARGIPSGRAGMLLAPLLVLAARAGEASVLNQVMDAISLMLAHQHLSPEDRDGFTKECRSYSWPDLAAQDEAFQTLGIGAPLPSQLLFDRDKPVPPGLLKASLSRAIEHLARHRALGAFYILYHAFLLPPDRVTMRLLGRR